MVKTENLSGNKYGRLTVIRQINDYITPRNIHYAKWECKCDCGNICYKLGKQLKNGKTHSCGCLTKEILFQKNKKYNTYNLSGEYGIGYTSKKEEFYFDLKDYDKIKNYYWNINKEGYVVTTGGTKMHQILFNRSNNFEVDHKNHIKNDNRKENLRCCTHQENMMNKQIYKNNTSGVTGVTWKESLDKWNVRIQVNNKRIHLGYFSDFDEAVKVRKQAEIQYFGEYRYKGDKNMSFIDSLKETLNEDTNISVSENGALGYRTSGKSLLDLNFGISSMRNMSEDQIEDKFVKAFYEDKLLAVKWLFYARDREAIGERRLFRVCIKYLANNHPDIAKALVSLVAEYGRFDDLWCLLDTSLKDDIVALVDKQLTEDMENMKANKNISLLAKWMPSINTSSYKTKDYAKLFCKELDVTPRQYRKMLSKLRAHLKVVEAYMSRKEWSAIDYSAVPSRANLIYNNAFLRNDEERRRKYLSKLEKGETKINAGVLFPHDIVHRYCEGTSWYTRVKSKTDTTLEELWKALPDYVQESGNTICTLDGSGSMSDNKVGGTRISALEVANALGIYFAERSSGQFKNTYITFSTRPRLVDLSNGKTLREKIEIALRYNEVSNTNIEAVFDLILDTAINKNMTQNELPQNILLISDMEYDDCAQTNSRNKPNERLFKTIAKKYANYGYKLPRLVFWNVNSRTGTIPVKENELGVALVSGFSPAIVKMVLSNKTDPFECLLEQLNDKRYDPVHKAIIDLV